MFAYFPVEWGSGDRPSDGAGGPPVEDSGSVYVCAGEDVYEGGALADTAFSEGDVMMRTSLKEMVSDVIDGFMSGDHIDPQHAPALINLRSAFELCIAQINSELEKLPPA